MTLVSAGLLLFLITVPIFLASLPFIRLRDRRNDKEYTQFLADQEGSILFIYTSKKKTLEFTRNEIVPGLPSDVQVVYLNGKIPESNLERKHVSTLLYRIRPNGGFPLAVRILEGRTQVWSLNKKLNEALQKRQPDVLFHSLNDVTRKQQH